MDSCLSRRLQALAHCVQVRPTYGPPDQPTILLALPVSRVQVHARVMLMDVDILACAPALLQLLPRLGKQSHELALVVECGHHLRLLDSVARFPGRERKVLRGPAFEDPEGAIWYGCC